MQMGEKTVEGAVTEFKIWKSNISSSFVNVKNTAAKYLYMYTHTPSNVGLLHT